MNRRAAMLLAGGLAATSCHWVFPHSPGLSNSPRAERGVEDATPKGEMAHRDAPITVRSDAVRQQDSLLLVDASRGDGKKDQGKADAVPRDKGKADAMPRDQGKADTSPGKADGTSDGKPGACLSWAGGWSCSSNLPDLCAATCGVLRIICADAAGKCRCDSMATGAVNLCNTPVTGYCQNCAQALASNCCQGL